MTNGFKKDGKFHPITEYKKGTRKSRDQKAKQQGIKLKDKKVCSICKDPFIPRPQSAETRNVCKKCIKALDPKERKQRQVMASQLSGMSQAKKAEWEDAVGSEVVKVKKEMMNGRPVTSVRFANGEEWFEFEEVKHQEEYMKKENIEVDESIVGEFVEIEHPDIAGYITMTTGKVLFGEREDRSKRYKTVFPYKGRSELAELKFKDLPDQLQDDLSDLAEPSGQMTLQHPEMDWNEMTEKQRLEFIEGIRDDFGN